MNAGATGSDKVVVDVVDGGTGPVNETTNDSCTMFPMSAYPTATLSDTLTHDMAAKKLARFVLGLVTTAHDEPFRTSMIG